MSIDFKKIESVIGYNFDNIDLLQQAFVRRSYSVENGGQNNEVLEFIGDKALDFAVIRLMMNRFGRITEDKQWNEFKLTNPKYFQTKLDEGKFTDIKKMLVDTKSLSKCIDKLGFHTQLIMGKGDIAQNVQEQDSVKENLFEAIIGAVTLDCDYDMDVITEVVDTMLDLDAFFDDDLEEDNYEKNYIGLLQEWSQSQGFGLPNYCYHEISDGYSCEVKISNGYDFNAIYYGRDLSKAKARADAAYQAYTDLRNKGYIGNEFEEAVGEPIYEESIRQINELFQKRLIYKPNYKFNLSHDNNGDPEWECILSVKGYDDYYGYATTKKEAQREAVYDFLCYLMDIEDDCE